MEEVQMLKKQIEDNKRKIKALEQKDKSLKVPKRELEKFKKLYDNLKTNNLYKYYRFLDDIHFFGIHPDMVDNITTWFGMDVEEVEKARQYINFINDGELDEYFEKAIKYVKEELNAK